MEPKYIFGYVEQLPPSIGSKVTAPMVGMDRTYELVVYGATGIQPDQKNRLIIGYTGKLATKYIVQNCPTDLKWAVAGRDHSKLTALINEIKELNIDRIPPGLLVADSNDLEGLTLVARSTKVVVAFAGPFLK